jgi:hypothetical protein
MRDAAASRGAIEQPPFAGIAQHAAGMPQKSGMDIVGWRGKADTIDIRLGGCGDDRHLKLYLMIVYARATRSPIRSFWLKPFRHEAKWRGNGTAWRLPPRHPGQGGESWA